ncbi:hypothetical protein LTR49_024932 [Elasticomyces elasticus]|nr:hypothetical protein LTR49_024932 [Elasticomyces elasticus]
MASGAASIVWPEYSGNRLYQTLGNLTINPPCGICIPDFDSGDMLYVTGTTQIYTGKDASELLPRSNLCVQLMITAARFFANAPLFRGIEGETSPYNPTVRYLTTEHRRAAQTRLLSQAKLSPTISRFRISLENATTHTSGQHVTLDFSEHLDHGYSHMREDDPRSLNDDFVRTFTVSSPPGGRPDLVRRLKDDEFEITIRNVGVVTYFLCKHKGTLRARELEAA